MKVLLSNHSFKEATREDNTEMTTNLSISFLIKESAPTMIQSRPKLKLTRPKEPEFETAQRVHAIGVKSSAELEEEMLVKIPTFKAHPLKKKFLEALEAKPCETSTPLQEDKSLSSVSNSLSSVSLDILSNEASSFAFPILPSSMAASSGVQIILDSQLNFLFFWVLSDLAFIVLMVFFLLIADAKYEGDIQALFSLRSSFSIRPDHILSWFDAETARCNCSGITCNGVKVETIDVFNIPLNLPIPTCIGQFQSLVYIAARGARLIGEIPKELGYCKSLKHLDLSFNSLTGPLPENLCGLKLIINFIVEGNLFSGPIPKWISSWKLPNTIYLEKNQFFGALPPLKFRYLKTFSASNNWLSGDIPSFVCETKSLSSLLLSGNNFTGRLINVLEGCNSFKELDLSPNQLYGKIPDYLGELPLKSVILYSSNFSGPMHVKLRQSQTITNVFS